MELILREFGAEKKARLQESHSLFLRIIARLEEVYQVRPFNQQTAQSLTELYALVHAVRPRTIFELGAGSRSSTLALSLAAAQMSPRPSIFCLDLAPADFPSLASGQFPDLQFAPVQDIAMEATKFSIPGSWEQPIFMLYDAHDDDLPGIKIFPHAQSAWFPNMPGAVIAVHDCSVYTSLQSDLPQSYHQAVYSPDVTIVGYGEVPGLVQFLQEKKLILGFPGREMEQLGIGREGTSLVYFQLPEG